MSRDDFLRIASGLGPALFDGQVMIGAVQAIARQRGDVLVVTKLDRLGRDAIDVSTTVAKLETLGIRVHCLALGGVDLTSSAGKLTMGVINAVAQFERDLLIERTQSGLARAKAQGKALGRPSTLSADEQALVRERIADGETVSSIARDMGTSRQTIMRARDSEPK